MSARGRKRKAVDLDDEYDRLVALGDPNRAPVPAPVAATPSKTKRAKAVGASGSSAEKRLARVRNSCPQNIMDRVIRVMSQRFYMIARTRNGQDLREEFKVLGSTGNVYTVVVDKLPSCDCPDAQKGNHCKHILFIMLKVLAVPQSSTLYYQKALLSTELEQIFAQAPAAPTSATSSRLIAAYEKATGRQSTASGASSSTQEQRIEEGDDCAICYDGMDAGKLDLLTFCVTCNKPVHKGCFTQWARTARPLTCVYCRSPWHDASAAGSSGAGASMSSEGYLNLAGAAGVSSARDTSSYYNGPRRGQRWMGYGGGWGHGYEDDY